MKTSVQLASLIVSEMTDKVCNHLRTVGSNSVKKHSDYIESIVRQAYAEVLFELSNELFEEKDRIDNA